MYFRVFFLISSTKYYFNLILALIFAHLIITRVYSIAIVFKVNPSIILVRDVCSYRREGISVILFSRSYCKDYYLDKNNVKYVYSNVIVIYLFWVNKQTNGVMV